jgi:hypothetical protein
LADSSHEFADISRGPVNTSRTAMASAVSEKTVTAPAAKASDRMSAGATAWDRVSKKSVKKISARMTSPVISTSQGLTRSASTPAGRPAARQPALPGSEASTAASGLRVSCMTSRGMAKMASPSPSMDTAWPPRKTCSRSTGSSFAAYPRRSTPRSESLA